MAVEDAAAAVTICRGQGLFLRTDDSGVLMRNFHFGRSRRIAWSEISHFADGCYTKEGVTSWLLVIVLRTGKQAPVLCSVLAPVDEVMAAVREAAQPHGIPADLTGLPAKSGGRPAVRGLYDDPGGQDGLRYWDGRRWSPLLPLDIGESSSTNVQKAPDSWSELPVADGRWAYAAVAAKVSTVRSVVAAAMAAGLLALILVYQPWLYQHAKMSVGAWVEAAVGGAVFIAFFALMARGSWRERRFFLKLDAAAKRALGNWS
jgi:hypothetical protein